MICHDCSSKHFGQNRQTCPVCATPLDARAGIAAIDLIPSSDKIKALCGLDPSFIFQVASRAIDFYNFQSELSRAHDTQELESAKHQLSHQTQQHALSQKDLNNQLRTLKFQLESIVAERDAQIRLVQELQERLAQTARQNQPLTSTPSNRVSAQNIANAFPHTLHAIPAASLVTPPAPQILPRTVIEIADPNTRAPADAPRLMWHTPQAATSISLPERSAESANSATRSSGSDRRTRLFASPSPGAAPVTSPSSANSTYATPRHAPEPPSRQTIQVQATTSYGTNAAQTRVSTTGLSSRFSHAPLAPARPETPLLHRLAGLSSRPSL